MDSNEKEDENLVEKLQEQLRQEQEKISLLMSQIEDAKSKEKVKEAAKAAQALSSQEQLNLRLEVGALQEQLCSEHYVQGNQKKRKRRIDAGTRKGCYGVPDSNEQKQQRLLHLGIAEEDAQKLIAEANEESIGGKGGALTSFLDRGFQSLPLFSSMDRGSKVPEITRLTSKSLHSAMPEYPMPPHLQTHLQVAPNLFPVSFEGSSLGLTLDMGDIPLKLKQKGIVSTSVSRISKKRHLNARKLLNRPKCEEPDCFKTPGFGFQRFKPRFCKAHAYIGMINVMSQRCENLDCVIRPSFAFKGEKPRFCEKHRIAGMVNVKSPTCSNTDPPCEKQANFSFEVDGLRYCSLHKQDGMQNWNSPSMTCHVEGCTHIRRCGMPGKKRIYCIKHRLPGMDRVDWAACFSPGCMTDAAYTYAGAAESGEHAGSNPIVPLRACEQHKLLDMVPFRTKKKKNQAENTNDDSKEKPKESSRADRKRLLQIKCMKRDNGLCEYDEQCLELGKFSKPLTSNKRLACFLHKTDDMTPWQKCVKAECDKKAMYGINDMQPSHCLNHRLEGMVCVTKASRKYKDSSPQNRNALSVDIQDNKASVRFLII